MNERRDPNVTSDYLPSEVSQDSTKQESPASEDTKAFILAENAKESRALPQIAGYVVQRELARGGMGRVLAAIDTTLDRDVAIKILLPGAPPDRFIRESQITARLPHPGIPPVYSLGELPDGSPYLAMKLIDGRTLVSEIKGSDRQQLLQIFLQICQAVGFAHSRGVIHRDLKPANVMVGAFGEVQVMDWGLAKEFVSSEASAPAELADTRTGGDTIDSQKPHTPAYEQTELGVVMGTPSYMSPEQARGETLDARVDVFALGGILLSILTKFPPFMGNTSAEVVKKAAAADLSEAFQKLESCEADAELIAICRKCLSPKPADRPADGQAVATAISAHLSNLQARLRGAEISTAQAKERETAAKRTRKIQIIAASLIFTALAVGLGVSLWQYREAASALGRALFAESEEKKRSTELAKSREQEKLRADDLAKSQFQEKLRADELSQVAQYQAEMLKQITPEQAGSILMKDIVARYNASIDKTDLTVDEKQSKKSDFEKELYQVSATDAAVELIDAVLLKPAANTIEAEFAQQPLVDARLRLTLEEVYTKLGRHEKALELAQGSYAKRKQASGELHVDTLRSRLRSALALNTLQKLDEGEKELRFVLAESEKRFGKEHRLTIESKVGMAELLEYRGELEQGEQLAREVLSSYLAMKNGDPNDVDEATNLLGKFLMKLGKYPEAEALYSQVVETQRKANSLKAEALNNLGTVYLFKRDFAKAEPYIREAVALGAIQEGDNHPSSIARRSNLVTVLMETSKFAEAEALALAVLQECRQMFGNDDYHTVVAMNVLGRVLTRQQRFKEAEPFQRQALQIGRRTLGDDHPDVIVWIFNMADILKRLERFQEAEPLYREALERNRRKLGENHPYTLIMTKSLADFLRQIQKYPESEKYLLEARELLTKARGEEDAENMSVLEMLGVVYREQGKLPQAQESLQKVIDWRQRTAGPNHATTLQAILRMAAVKDAQEDPQAVIDMLTPLDGKISQAFPPNIGPLRQASLKGLLGKSQAALAKADADFKLAEQNLLEAQTAFAKSRGDKDKETIEWITALTDLYTKWNKSVPNAGHDKSAETWKAKLAP
jgi:serine/threonine protein kinase